MRVHHAFGSYRRFAVIALVALSLMGVLSPVADAQLPSGIAKSAEECIPSIIDGYMTRQFDPATAAALKAHQATEDSDLGRQLAAARERMQRALKDLEADEITPAKVRAALQMDPRTSSHLDIYDAEVARLRQSGGMSATEVATRAWLRVRDAPFDGRILSEPDDIAALDVKRLVFAADYPLSDSERSMLSPAQRANSYFGLTGFITYFAVPGVRFPDYHFPNERIAEVHEGARAA